jgi:YMGG-like Gly-zipper
MMRTSLAAAAGILAIGSLAAAQNMYVYPQKGQSASQQQKDETDCNGWAMQQTGYNPMASTPQVAEERPRGGVVRGGARGAAVGAVGGAIAGDAGKGAAIGAAAGGMVGGMRRMDQRRDQAYAQDQIHQQEEAQKAEMRRAYAACLEGRGYTVR